MILPKDKTGSEIRPGDILRMRFNVRMRERPGGRRVAINAMTECEVVVPDEGCLLPPSEHWVDFVVEWCGACLTARRVAWSDFQTIMSGECFDIATGKRVSASTAMHYLNAAFDGSLFEVKV